MYLKQFMTSIMEMFRLIALRDAKCCDVHAKQRDVCNLYCLYESLTCQSGRPRDGGGSQEHAVRKRNGCGGERMEGAALEQHH